MSIPKTGPVGTFEDFSLNGNDGNVGVEADIQPAEDGQELRSTAVTDLLRRPPDNLRQRTEQIRGVIDDLYWLRDADRAQLLYGGSTTVTWNSGTGVFTIDNARPLFLFPFLTVGNAGNTPTVGRSKGVIQLQRADNTEIIAVTFNPFMYQGGDRYNIVVQGGGAHGVVVSGYNIVVTVVAGVTTRLQVITDLNGALGGTATAAAIAGADGDIVKTVQPKQYTFGCWDSSAHQITNANLATFLGGVGNALLDGDSVCIRYDMLIDGGGSGGRRQSLPENGNTVIPAAAIFNSRVHPEWLPNALPIAKRVGDVLMFVNGASFFNGSPQPFQAPTLHAIEHAATGSDPIDYSTLGGLVAPGFEMACDASGTQIRLTPFAAIIAGRMRQQLADLTLTTGVALPNGIGGMAIDTWYYVYAYWTGSAVALEVVTQGPDTQRRTKATDNTRTYLGAFNTTHVTPFVRGFHRKNRTTDLIFDDNNNSNDNNIGNPKTTFAPGDALAHDVDLSKMVPPHIGYVGQQIAGRCWAKFRITTVHNDADQVAVYPGPLASYGVAPQYVIQGGVATQPWQVMKINPDWSQAIQMKNSFAGLVTDVVVLSYED